MIDAFEKVKGESSICHIIQMFANHTMTFF